MGVLGEAREHGGVVADGLARGGGGGHDEVAPRRGGGDGGHLVAEEPSDAVAGEGALANDCARRGATSFARPDSAGSPSQV